MTQLLIFSIIIILCTIDAEFNQQLNDCHTGSSSKFMHRFRRNIDDNIHHSIGVYLNGSVGLRLKTINEQHNARLLMTKLRHSFTAEVQLKIEGGQVDPANIIGNFEW
jgi:hypothetical protein